MQTQRHRPIFMEAPGSDTAVLMIHGIQGSPDQFTFLVEALAGQYTVQTLLLPGHGGMVRDFAKSRMAVWQAYVDDALLALTKRYRRVFIVGHSMGCLLGLQAAVSHPDKVAGLVLLAPAFRVFISRRCVACNAKMLFAKAEDDEIVAAMRQGNSVSASSPFAYLLGAPRFLELLQKARACRPLIGQCGVPMAVVHSENDEIISRKTVDLFQRRPNTRVYMAKKSSHYYYPPQARKALAKLVREFIQTNR